MASFTVLYTKPETDPDGFVEEYTRDHLAIAAKFPKMSSVTTTVFSGTPRRTAPAYFLMFQGQWETDADLMEAMQHPALMEASGHAMKMLQKYGNKAEMLIGD
ncbi:MAG: hypothetical protein ACI9OB_000197 [Nonlabens sp.]